MMKASLRLKMHEHDLALKPLYKLSRLFDKKLDSDEDRDLKVLFYMLMADVNLARKEFILAYDFTLKGLAVQNKHGGAKVAAIVRSRNAAMEALLKKDVSNKLVKKLSFR